MLKLAAFLLITQVLTSPIAPCHAEVHLHQDSLSVNINDVPMKDVLNDIREQGDLNIVAFEETQIGNVRISKKFWNLPLEAGLDRLLSDWNYGINRHATTGKITTLYLVSRRLNPSTLPVRSSLPNKPSSRETYESQTNPNILTENDDDSNGPESEDDGYDEFSPTSILANDEEL